MVSTASFIDVAIVESMSDDFEFATRSRALWVGYAKTDEDRRKAEENLEATRKEYVGEAKRIHYRVVERLMGNSAETFYFNGIGIDPVEGRTVFSSVRLADLKRFLDQRDLADSSGPGSCENPPYGIVGRGFLIVRDAEGAR